MPENGSLLDHGRSACTNGPDEYGNWPCDPVDNGDGTATCSECNWTAPYATREDEEALRGR
jgi:hypothetical protein